MLERSMERMRRKNELEFERDENKLVDFKMINYFVQLQLYSNKNTTDVKNFCIIKTKLRKSDVKKLKEKKQPIFCGVQNLGKIKTEFSKGDVKELKEKKMPMFRELQSFAKIKTKFSKGDMKKLKEKKPKIKKPTYNSNVPELV